ncbi:LptA/OstA family protein [Trichothermofontia sp.]
MNLTAINQYWRYLGVFLVPPLALAAMLLPPPWQQVWAQAAGQAPGRALTLRSDVQEANAKTGVVTARGNVQINYPARQIQATSAQAQYFSKERRIILTGDVFVLQEGNSLRGERVTYLIDEGRFIAHPQPSGQVESIYIVSDPNAPTQPPVPIATPLPTPNLATPPAVADPPSVPSPPVSPVPVSPVTVPTQPFPNRLPGSGSLP